MPEELFEDRAITGVLKIRINRVPDEIEKGGQERIAEFLG
jgi:hypothetical protein